MRRYQGLSYWCVEGAEVSWPQHEAKAVRPDRRSYRPLFPKEENLPLSAA